MIWNSHENALAKAGRYSQAEIGKLGMSSTTPDKRRALLYTTRTDVRSCLKSMTKLDGSDL